MADAPNDAEADYPAADAEELYENAPCAYLSTLPNGRIVRVNQTFVEWIGWSREELVGKVRFQELLSIGARMYYETHYAPLLQIQDFVTEIALEMRRADGGARPVVASARRIRDAAGVTREHRVALFDSTDRRRYERELLVARRLAEEAQRRLEDAAVKRNAFIAMLAHELRNPLAPLRGAAAIFRQLNPESDILEKTTAMMERQVTQMARLVDDLLDVSRIGQDKLSLLRVPVDLVSVIHYAVEMSEPLLRQAGVALSVSMPPSRVYVEADAARLAQAIGNILNNAAKFTPRGGSVTVTVVASGSEAAIRIRDTGIGIAQPDLEKVFEMFAQAKTPQEGRDGLGLGLSIARSLVERHDGRISVHSEGLGKGSEFTVSLPVLQGALESVTQTFPSVLAPAPASAPKRILVVDDNRDSAEMMAILLEVVGHEIRTAHDGLAAVEASAEFHPDVVLLDIGLPILTGYQAAARIRAQPGRKPVLIALTGWGQEEDRARSHEAGFDHHLVKPIEHDALLNLLSALPARSS